MFNFFLGIIVIVLAIGILFVWVYAWLINYERKKQATSMENKTSEYEEAFVTLEQRLHKVEEKIAQPYWQTKDKDQTAL